MKPFHTATLIACMAVGPCIVINPERTWNVYQYGAEGNHIDTTVTKEESFDGKFEGKITGIEASATATANIGSGANAKDAGKAAGKEVMKGIDPNKEAVK